MVGTQNSALTEARMGTSVEQISSPLLYDTSSYVQLFVSSISLLIESSPCSVTSLGSALPDWAHLQGNRYLNAGA